MNIKAYKIDICDIVCDCILREYYDVGELFDRCMGYLEEEGVLTTIDEEQFDELLYNLRECITNLIEVIDKYMVVGKYSDNVGVTIDGSNLIVGINVKNRNDEYTSK